MDFLLYLKPKAMVNFIVKLFEACNSLKFEKSSKVDFVQRKIVLEAIRNKESGPSQILSFDYM
jgi:hypothetical protein